MNPKRLHNEIGLSQANRIDRTQCLSIQKIIKLMYSEDKDLNKLKNYQKIKYQGVIYKIGEFVEILHLGSNQPYVAKIVNIAELTNPDREKALLNKIDIACPLIQVEWYMRKIDIPKNHKFTDQFKKVISDNEVFESGIFFVLPLEAIYQKCEVLTLKEYSFLEVVDSQIFFNRAAYNCTTETFTPRIDQWQPKYCLCERAYNPDLEWIECDRCQNWYHQECVFSNFNKQKPKEFICDNCTKKNAEKKKKK